MKIIHFIKKVFKNAWAKPYKWPYIVAGIALLALLILFSASRPAPELSQKQSTFVEVKNFSSLTSEITIEKTGTVEPAVFAPLVARTGGRVTRVNSDIGSTVRAGSTVVSIDTGAVANPAATQASGLNEQLKKLNDVEKATMKATDIAITISKLNLDAATANRSLTSKQAASARQSANTAKKNAEEVNEVSGLAGDLGDLAVEAATLALDQAKISQSLTIRGGNDALQQARQGLKNAENAKESALANLVSQRQQIITSRNVASAQVKLQQVVSPVNGQVVKLNVRPGSFVNPGQVIGEVNAAEGAYVSLDISPAIHSQLTIGQQVNINGLNREFSGVISALATASSTASGLWQADVFITETPSIIHPGELVTINLPAAPQLSDSVFIPLDIVTVRDNGITLFTLEDGIVVEHLLTAIGYTGQYLEAELNLPDDTQVIVVGGRTLQAGDQVEINS